MHCAQDCALVTTGHKMYFRLMYNQNSRVNIARLYYDPAVRYCNCGEDNSIKNTPKIRFAIYRGFRCTKEMCTKQMHPWKSNSNSNSGLITLDTSIARLEEQNEIRVRNENCDFTSKKMWQYSRKRHYLLPPIPCRKL